MWYHIVCTILIIAGVVGLSLSGSGGKSGRERKKMKLTFLMENKTYREGIKAEHGLSVYIEAEDMNILFDAGATDAFISNALSLGVELESVEAAVVSHGHYDHTGGFPAFCGIIKALLFIYIKTPSGSPSALKARERKKSLSGIRWSREERNAFEDRLVFYRGTFKAHGQYMDNGNCWKRTGNFVPSERFYWTDEEGNTIEDDMSHEQCLVIREKEGPVYFFGLQPQGSHGCSKGKPEYVSGRKSSGLCLRNASLQRFR